MPAVSAPCATGNNFGNEDDSPTTRTSDAVIALDASTGAVRWVNQRTEDDTFTTAFHPSSDHPDLDFGDSPEVSGEHLAEVAVGPPVSGPSISGRRVFVGAGDVVNIAAEDPTSGGVVALAP